ncbi:hypothetical protein GCM10020331_074270 [Ectobacillus funiculus]
MTRMDDTFVSLSERANRANAWGADAFISIHCNSGGGKGFESYRYSGVTDSRTIAFQKYSTRSCDGILQSTWHCRPRQEVR